MKTHIFTEKDFIEFSSCVQKFIEALGITGWHHEILHEQIGSGVTAETRCVYTSKLAVFRLTKQVEYDFGMIKDMNILAKHEVLHMLLWNYCQVVSTASDPFCDDVCAQEHELINRLLMVV